MQLSSRAQDIGVPRPFMTQGLLASFPLRGLHCSPAKGPAPSAMRNRDLGVVYYQTLPSLPPGFLAGDPANAPLHGMGARPLSFVPTHPPQSPLPP